LPRPAQGIHPGTLKNAYGRELQSFLSKNVLARLWAKDVSLWPAEPHQAEILKSNLSWLDLPQQLGTLVTRVAARAAEIEPAFPEPNCVNVGTQQILVGEV